MGGKMASGSTRYSEAERAADRAGSDDRRDRRIEVAKVCARAGVPGAPMSEGQRRLEARKIGERLDE